MNLGEAIKKVEKDNHIEFGEDLLGIDFFFNQPNVFLEGTFSIKDLKLIIDVLTLAETK